MIVFNYESLSCVGSNGLEIDLYDKTSRAALCLSLYFVIITALPITIKAVSHKERGEGLTTASQANFRLKNRQKIQGALGEVTALASMYLFSILGVQGDPNDIIYMVGTVGSLALGLVVLIDETIILAIGGSRGGEQIVGTSQAPRKASRSDLSEASNLGRKEACAGGYSG